MNYSWKPEYAVGYWRLPRHLQHQTMQEQRFFCQFDSLGDMERGWLSVFIQRMVDKGN